MARALMAALSLSGRETTLVSRLRSFDRNGDRRRQMRIKRLGERVADRLIARFHAVPAEQRPAAWITYHAYHKSPDWLGPLVKRALGIPYLLIETSFADKQAGGAWDLGHVATRTAIGAADVTLAMTAVDEAGLSPLIEAPGVLKRLPPFLDPAPYREAALGRKHHRRRLADHFDLAEDRPWLLAVGMMRNDVKRSSYGLLAEALSLLRDRPWQLLIVGGGIAQPEIKDLFSSFGSKRVKFAGILDESQLPACYAASDVYAWPAVREAYGMAFLEAQASGLPVVAGLEGGVADVVRNGVTGILTPPRDPAALSSAIADLLDQPAKRIAMSKAAIAFVEHEHGLDRAATVLDQALNNASVISESRAESTGSVSALKRNNA